MNRLPLLLLAWASLASAEISLAGQYGEASAFMGARAGFDSGTNGFLSGSPGFQQQFRGLDLEFGINDLAFFRQGKTNFGALVGFEVQVGLGAAENQKLSTGGTIDAERRVLHPGPNDASWTLMADAQARLKVSPFHFSNETFSARLGVMGGVAVEFSGVRYEGAPGGWTVGADAGFTLETIAARVAWVYLPPQGETFAVSRHTVSAALVLGPVLLGFNLHLVKATLRATLPLEVPSGVLESRCLEGQVGYAF